MTNIKSEAYVVTPIAANNQTSYNFPFWAIQNAGMTNTSVVVQILNGNNIRTLREGTDYKIKMNASSQGGNVLFGGAAGTGFIPTPSDGQYLMFVSNVPFKQEQVFGQPPSKFQVGTAFDNHQQQINQLHACCDRAIHTQFDVATQTYPVISVFAHDFKPDDLLMLDHTGKVIIDAGFGKSEIDELKKQAALIAQNIQTIANFAASAGASATQAAKDRLDALQAVTDATRILGETKAAGTTAVTDITKLKTDTLNAINTAKADIASLTRTSVAEINQKLADALAKMQPEIQKAIDASKIAVQAATDGQTAEANAKASEQATKAIEAALTPINNLFKGAGNKDDVVARNQAGAWAVESGGDHLKSVMLDMLANGQLLWRDQDQIVPIDKTSFGGGGTGGGTGGSYDHKVIHTAQDDGTAPVTKQSETDHYAMLQVPYADPTDQMMRSGKMPKVNALGNNWEYVAMPAPDTIMTVKPTAGTTSTPTLDLSTLVLPNTTSQYTVTAHFDKPTNKWTFLATSGGNMSGNTIPNPPNDGKNHYIATKVDTNGGVVVSTPLVPFPVPTAQDIGKVAVVDSTNQAFEYITPLSDTEATKRVISQSGVVDNLEVLSKSKLTFILKPFNVAYTDTSTKIMSEHSYVSNQSITVPQDSTTTVYVKPSDWSIQQANGEPTEAIRQANVVLCVVYSKSDIQHIEWSYDPISHQERVLGDVARGLGAFARGVFLKPDAKGLVNITSGYIYDFIGRGEMSKHVVGDLTSFYKMTAGLLAASSTSVLLQKVYYDTATSQENALDRTHQVVIHNIVSGASYVNTAGTMIDKAIIVIGSKTYPNKATAKKFLAEAREDVQIAALMSTNMVLLAQIIVEVTDSANTDIDVYNYAGIRSSTSAVTRKDSIPQGSQADDNSVLKYKNGAYTLDKTIIPATVDPNIQPGQVITSGGGNKLVGTDPTTLKLGAVTQGTKMINIGIIRPVNSGVTQNDQTFTSGQAGIDGHGIVSARFRKGVTGDPKLQPFDLVLKLQPGLISSINDIKRIRMYCAGVIFYSYDAQFFNMSGTNEITCYQMVLIDKLRPIPTHPLKLSITIFYGGV